MSAKEIIPTVDWITATVVDNAVGQGWYDLLGGDIEAAARNGETTALNWEKIRRYGYEGVHWEGVFVGKRRNQGYICIAPGQWAATWFSRLALSARRVSRLDLAVTVTLPRARPNLANVAYRANEQNTARKYSIIQSSGHGRTMYVGSRESGQMGRLYDKGVQAGIAKPGHIWRYEVEIKDKLKTLPMLHMLYDKWRLGKMPKGDIAGYVHQWFYTRGVTPVFSARESRLSEITTRVDVTSNERKLTWLNQQVAPTVQHLIREGLGAAALEALGLEAEQLPMWDRNGRGAFDSRGSGR